MSTVDNKQDKSRVASCFIELPHFPQAFRSDVDQLQVHIFLIHKQEQHLFLSLDPEIWRILDDRWGIRILSFGANGISHE